MSLRRKLRRESGFTLMECAIALLVLSIGLLGMASLMSQAMTTTDESSYMSRAAVLASEKLEDLNRYPDTDPAVAVAPGGVVGNLTADVTQNVAAGGVVETVDYFDTVFLSSTDGSISETIQGGAGAGNANSNTTTYRPDGTPPATAGPAAFAAATNTVAFRRRWIIEQDPVIVVGAPPVVGVKRVTVRVTLITSSAKPVPPFQMSVVRP